MEQLRGLEEYVAQADRIINLLVSKSRGKIRDPEEAEAFDSAIEALKKENKDTRRRLSHLREAVDDIEALSQAVTGLKMQEEEAMGRLIVVMIETEILEGLQGDQHEDSSTMECDESEPDATDVFDQLREKARGFESNLHFMFTRFFYLLRRRRKEEVNAYEEFKSSLKWLKKNQENRIVRGILDLVNSYEKKVLKFWNSKGKVEKGGRVDSLLEQFLENIQLVAFLVDQSGRTEPEVSSLGDLIEGCEADQEEIKSKINALTD